MNNLSRMPYWLRGCVIGIVVAVAIGFVAYLLLWNADPFPFLGGSNDSEFSLRNLLRFYVSSLFLFVFLLPLLMFGILLGVGVGQLKRKTKFTFPFPWISLAIVIAAAFLCGSYFGLF